MLVDREKEKIETEQNKHFLEEYLYERGLSTQITENPRYDSILWKLSNLIRKSGFKSYTDKAKELINNIVQIDEAKSIIMLEGLNKEGNLITSKYYIDSEDEQLKRTKLETVRGSDKPLYVESSVYNDDGIEIMKETHQRTDDLIRFERITRLENRIDVIKIERAEQSVGGEITKLADMYKSRFFHVGIEDIEPEMEEIDPLNVMRFDILGMPPIYTDVSLEELSTLKDNDGRVMPLPEQCRQQKLEEYKRLNRDYSRTRAFEKGIAKMLIVKDRDLKQQGE